MIRASKKTYNRKATKQTGFRKQIYPSFNRDVLNYSKFKKGGLMKLFQSGNYLLVVLRESVPDIAKPKIADARFWDALSQAFSAIIYAVTMVSNTKQHK